MCLHIYILYKYKYSLLNAVEGLAACHPLSTVIGVQLSVSSAIYANATANVIALLMSLLLLLLL